MSFLYFLLHRPESLSEGDGQLKDVKNERMNIM